MDRHPRGGTKRRRLNFRSSRGLRPIGVHIVVLMRRAGCAPAAIADVVANAEGADVNGVILGYNRPPDGAR